MVFGIYISYPTNHIYRNPFSSEFITNYFNSLIFLFLVFIRSNPSTGSLLSYYGALVIIDGILPYLKVSLGTWASCCCSSSCYSCFYLAFCFFLSFLLTGWLISNLINRNYVPSIKQYDLFIERNIDKYSLSLINF